VARSAADKIVEKVKRVLKPVAIILGIVFLTLAGCFALNQIPYSRAKPPNGVVDISSCLAWLKKPISAYRISTDRAIYYQITGPAGGYLPSGDAAYSFNSQGRFIGWTPDEGDLKLPTEVFVPGAKGEKISLDELK
jgi:hypothetical protein